MLVTSNPPGAESLEFVSLAQRPETAKCSEQQNKTAEDSIDLDPRLVPAFSISRLFN